MNSPVLSSFVPVVLFIALGYLSGRQGWIRAQAVKDLSNLVFMVLAPALLFRTMAGVHVQELDFGPIAVYFGGVALVFGATLAWAGFSTLGAVRALGHTFSNNVMVGVPLVGLVFGQAGLVTLFTLISVHALILLTVATVVLELALARNQPGGADGQAHVPPALWRMVLQALWSGLVHPVPLPIIAGLLYAQTGWPIPPLIDKPLQLLGQALGPLALLLVGVTLAFSTVGPHFRAALRIALVKNAALPLAVGALGWALGLSGLPLAVMVTAAALPVGANVFLFAQRYEVGQDEMTAGVTVSTALGMATVPVVLWVVTRWAV
ncbi:AEC family transporter [Simplicispira sedimenti]|uniref:AEC family transporter n=1 Tax=Simplicispira sedimenti TaxID=2919500 RepID=UPI001A462C3D|nr:AEC family transporter [Acidovorax sp. W1-6]MBL8365416.1 AEC family transporter [Comamonas sp.]